MIVQINEMHRIRGENKDKIIVFCSGTFDLTHAGHILFFEECEKLGDILVVAIGNDNQVKEYKGNGRPILNEKIRLKMVDSIKAVDYCLIDGAVTNNDLFSPILPIFEKLQPDIWAVNEDAFDIKKREKIAEKFNIELKVLPRNCPPEFEDISTTKIINKIKSLK